MGITKLLMICSRSGYLTKNGWPGYGLIWSFRKIEGGRRETEQVGCQKSDVGCRMKEYEQNRISVFLVSGLSTRGLPQISIHLFPSYIGSFDEKTPELFFRCSH